MRYIPFVFLSPFHGSFFHYSLTTSKKWSVLIFLESRNTYLPALLFPLTPLDSGKRVCSTTSPLFGVCCFWRAAPPRVRPVVPPLAFPPDMLFSSSSCCLVSSKITCPKKKNTTPRVPRTCTPSWMLSYLCSNAPGKAVGLLSTHQKNSLTMHLIHTPGLVTGGVPSVNNGKKPTPRARPTAKEQGIKITHMNSFKKPSVWILDPGVNNNQKLENFFNRWKTTGPVQFNKNFQEEIDNLCKKGTPIQASPALVTQLFLTLLQLEYRVQLPVINLISKFIHSHYFSKEHWPKKPQSPFHGVHRNPVGMSCYHLSFLPLDSYSHYSF